MKKKLVSILLVIVMLFSTSAPAFAATPPSMEISQALEDIDAAANNLKSSSEAAAALSKGFSSFLGTVSKFNTVVGAINGTTALLRMLGVMEDPTQAKLASIAAQIQSLDEKVTAMANDVKKIADNLTGLTADTKLNDRGVRANQMQQNWNSFNTNYVDKGIKPYITKYESAILDRVRDWVQYPETRTDIKLHYSVQSGELIYNKNAAYSSEHIIKGSDLQKLNIPWNPNTYPADIANAINTIDNQGFTPERMYAKDAVNILLYDFSVEAVNAGGSAFAKETLAAFNNYCAQLVNTSTAITSLVQSMYLTHAFEYQIRDQINELYNRILVEAGGYSIFAMNILGMSDSITDQEKENAAKTFCDTVKFLKDSQKNAVTGYDNYCYITNSPVHYSSIQFESGENIFTREWSENWVFARVQYRRLEIAQPSSGVFIKEEKAPVGTPVGDANAIAIFKTLQQNGTILGNVINKIKDPSMENLSWGNGVITSYGYVETLPIDNSVKVNCYKAIGNFIGGDILNTTLGSMPGDFSSSHFYGREKIDGTLFDITTGQMQSDKTLIASASFGHTEKSWKIDEAYAFWGPSDYPLIVDDFSKSSSDSFHNYFFGCKAPYPILVTYTEEKAPTPSAVNEANPLKDFTNYTKENGLIYQDEPKTEEERKAENHHAVSGDHTVSLLGMGDGGKDTPGADYVISAKPIEVPEIVKAKLGANWKVLASDDICVALNGNPAEGQFMIGFSGEGFEKYKNNKAVVYHVKDDGVVEALKPVWNEEYQCFTVITNGFSPFVLAVDPTAVNTGITANNTDLPVMIGFIALAVAGLCVVMVRRKEQ